MVLPLRVSAMSLLLYFHSYNRHWKNKSNQIKSAPRALTYEPPQEQRKSLYNLFPGHFPSDNAFPSLASPQVADTFASGRFTEL